MIILRNLITTSHKKVIRANMTKLKVTKLDVVTKRIRHRVNGVLDIGIRTGNGCLRISKSCMFMYCAPLLCPHYRIAYIKKQIEVEGPMSRLVYVYFYHINVYRDV